MSIINGLNYDSTHICKYFDNNQNVLLRDIADKFGMEKQELIELMLNCGNDEKDMVKRVIREDKRREKRAEKRKKSIHQHEPKPEQKPEIPKEEPEDASTLQIQRRELDEQLKIATSEAKSAAEHVNELQRLTRQSSDAMIKTKGRILRLKKDIIQIKTALNDAEDDLASTKRNLENQEENHSELLEKLELAKLDASQAEDEKEWVQLQIDELHAHIVFLISPFYTGKIPQEPGRVISSVKLDGVEFEEVYTNLENLSFNTVMELSRETGYFDIVELELAYKYAWLIMKYKSNPQYEVHTVCDDARIDKLINWLMK